MKYKKKLKKFGQVEKVHVHVEPVSGEAQNSGVLQVKIFVLFVHSLSAQKAVAALNLRWFGGRQISAGLYDHEKFIKGEFRAQQ